MDEGLFLQKLVEEKESLKQTWKLNDGKAFGMWFAMNYLNMDDTDAYESVSFDGGNDKDIDLFHVDDEYERVVVGQLKFNGRGAYVGKKGELLGLIHATDWLKDPESLVRDGRQDLADAATDYSEAIRNGYAVEYLYVYCGRENRDVMDAVRHFNVTEIGNIPARSCRIFTLETLKTIYEEQVDQGTRIASHEILVDHCFEERGDFGKAIVTTLTGEQLRSLHEQYGDKLFDRNVRLFLGANKGSVNAGIRDTLDSELERKNFWAYNNGVTFICDQYDNDGYGDGRYKLTIRNFSIVNGCQTTVSLANAPLEAVRDAKVSVRFIAAPERVINSIITYNNSQNPIRPWDLNAQDKLQKKLKREMGLLVQPYFYLLRKGELQQLSADEKNRFKRDGKIQVIPHDVNAQYLAAFKGLPAIAHKEKGKIFTTHRSEVFPPQIRVEELVLVWQAGRVAYELVRSELEKAIQNSEERRADILKRSAIFFVLAVMGILLHERNGNTFLNKIKPEVACSKKTHKRLQNYAQVALEWYVQAVSDLLDAGSTIAKLVRTQEGWQKIRPRILSQWRVYQVSKDVMESALPKL